MLRCRGIEWGGWQSRQSIGWWTKQGKKLIAFVKIWPPKKDRTNKVLQIKVFEKIGEGRNVSFDGEIEWIRGDGCTEWPSFETLLQPKARIKSVQHILTYFQEARAKIYADEKSFQLEMLPKLNPGLAKYKDLFFFLFWGGGGKLTEVESRSCPAQRSRRRRNHLALEFHLGHCGLGLCLVIVIVIVVLP